MNIEKMILDGTKYDGERENPYTFSASMSGNTLLQNYLIIVHGSLEQTRISDNTLGSIFHLGMETIVANEVKNIGYDCMSSEVKKSIELENGWTISGTTDLEVYDEYGVLSSIHDYKMVKQYAVKKILENPQGHHYAKQAHINRFIRKATDVKLFIETFSKDANALAGESTYCQIEIKPETFIETEMYLLSTTNELQEWIESGDIPPKCDDVWLRKLSKTSTAVIPSRCMFYCAHGKAGLCPHYKPDQSIRNTMSVVSNW